MSARLQRLQNNYEDFGMRRTVEGILVVHDHGHPHILMLQIANAFFKLYVLQPLSICSHVYRQHGPTSLTRFCGRICRPGDYLKPGEDEIDGLKRRLDERLAPPTDSRQFNASHGVDNEWEIGDCLAQWWRPNFETFMVRVVPSIQFPPTRPPRRHDATTNVTGAHVCTLYCTVPVHPCAHHQAKGVQEVVPRADAGAK